MATIVVGGHNERGVRAELVVVTVAVRAVVRIRVRMVRQLRSLVPGTMHNHLSTFDWRFLKAFS